MIIVQKDSFFRQCAGFSAAVAVGAAALYQGLVVRKYRLSTAKWNAGRRLRFVVVADLHSGSFGDRQQSILAEIRRLHPDYILLPGDIVDDRFPAAPAWTFLQEVASVAPCYYTPGNHEYRTRQMPAILARIRACGVLPLLDETRLLETPAGPLLLAGCEDAEKTRFDPHYHFPEALRTAFVSVAEHPAYTILLAHRPEYYLLYQLLGFDLVLSGHAHGGQVRIPYLLNGVFSPGQGLFPRHAGGYYQHGHTEHIVSRGVAVFPYIPRIFNPPEIVVVDVCGSSV